MSNEARQWKSSVRYLAYLVRCVCDQVPYNPQIINEHYAQYKRSVSKPHTERERHCAEAWDKNSKGYKRGM